MASTVSDASSPNAFRDIDRNRERGSPELVGE